MLEPAIPENEAARLAALRGLNLLDTPPDERFDRITRIAAQLFGVRMSVVTLVDAHRQWFKSRHGLDAAETPRSVSFCGHTILQPGVFHVADATQDPRFADNPLVQADPNIRFYAGAPLHTADGAVIGTLCVFDTKPREFSAADRKLLTELAGWAEQTLAQAESASKPLAERRWWLGILVTALAVGLCELLSAQVFQIPNPPAILLIAVVFAAYYGGLTAGVASAMIAWLYVAYFFSLHGAPFRYAGNDLARVLTWAVAMPAIAVMTGLLQRRTVRQFNAEKANAIAAASLTERGAAITELRASHEELRLVTENTPMSISFYDQHLRCAYANQSYARWLGVSLDSIIGKSIREILGEAAFSAIEPVLPRVFAGETVELEREHRHPDGRTSQLMSHLVPRIGEDRRVIGYYAFNADITERKKAELEISLARERLELALTGSKLTLWDLDCITGAVYLDPAWAQMTGGAPGETFTTVEKLLEYVHPDDGDRILEENIRVLKGEIPSYFTEHRVAHRNGEWLWILSHGKVTQRAPDGTALRMIGTNADITERKQAELILRESQQRFADVVGASGEYIWELDQAGNFTYVSSKTEQVFGYPGEEMLGRPPTDFMPAGEAQRWREHLADTVRRHEPFRKEQHIALARDGRQFWTEVSAVPVFSPQGGFIGYRGTGLDISDRKAAEERIQELATRDPLTALPNRLLLTDRIGHGIEVAQRSGAMFAVLFVDLDRFKIVNDSLGHGVGDALLQRVAKRLVNSLRKGDSVARLGGDEFVVIAEELARAEDAGSLAQKIIGSLSAPFEIDGHTLNISCSVGISIYPSDAGDTATLLKNADVAMYSAKEGGRRRHQFFSPALDARATEKLVLETHMRTALARQEFRLHYHPKFSLQTGALAGIEALARWHHTELGDVSPARFIPIAEDAGLIVPLGEWALNQACVQIRNWQRAGHRPVPMAVNLSVRQFTGDLVDTVRYALGDNGVAPHLLELEITESLLMHNVTENIAILRELSSLGVRIAIDDFGTGYSSLSYLRRFKLDTLKIDQSFVRGMSSNTVDLSIVNAIIALAQSLKIKVVAEGVETAEHRDMLRDLRCDEWQGHLICEPLPAEEFERRFLSELACSD